MKQLSRIFASLFLLLLLNLFPTSSSGQVSQGGVPRTVALSIAPDNRDVVVLSAPAMEAILEQDRQNPVPYRFAVNLPADLDFKSSGAWTTAMDGSRVWRLSISAPGALALTLYFDRFRLPRGGKLFVYNPSRTELLGAFTELNNNPQNTFATSLIQGDQLTLEYNTNDQLQDPDIHVSEVAYAYRGVPDRNLKTGFGASGACEVNINCSEGNGAQSMKRGVARIEVKSGGSTLWCTGSVVNNTRNDETPYVLTANHCGKNSSASDISKWIFYFNYEASGCPKPSVEPGNNSLTGAQMKAHADVTGSDFFLVLLNQSIPVSYNVYYNGWSRENIPSPSGVGIHHPQGDIKKISTYTSPLTTSTWNGNTHPSHWRVTWAGTTNGHGVTEGGSSGSPIFDNNGLLVGTLTGGDSYCDSTSLNLPDYYGKFSYDWDQNGSDSAKVLKYWLDPDSTGLMRIYGKMVGTGEQPSAARISVFPNPFRDKVKLEISGTTGRVQVRITDIWGKDHFNCQVYPEVNNSPTLDLSGFAPGMYLLILTDEERQTVRKIIKQ